MKRHVKKILHITIGILLVVLGVLGLVLPLLNGTILLILGAIVISFESSYVEKKLQSLTKKNATLYALYLRLEKFVRKVFKA